MDWKALLAMTINTVGVLLVTQAIKAYAPILRQAVPWLLPVLATSLGPIVAMVQNALAGWLGLPIDLSPLLALATGGAAVAAHQVYRQAGGPAPRLGPTITGLLVVGLTATGCASLLGNAPVGQMSAKQLHEYIKIKDAQVTCLIINSPYGKGTALFLTLDKAVIPAGSVTVDDNCAAKIITGPAVKPGP